jgi:P-type Mg2+ transporter
MVIAYLALIEIGKRIFYRAAAAPAKPRPYDLHHLRRRAARFSTAASSWRTGLVSFEHERRPGRPEQRKSAGEAI